MSAPNPDEALAATLLHRGKSLVPDRFPVPNPETVSAWAQVLGKMRIPAEMWVEAVDLWAGELVGDRMCTPRDLKNAAEVVKLRWESDPVRGPQLRQWRENRVVERDRQLREGTFAQIRGYVQRELPQKPPQDVASGLKYRRKGSG